MSRDLTDPRVATIIQALDRAAVYDQTHADCGALRTSAAIIMETGDNCDRFASSGREPWVPESARFLEVVALFESVDWGVMPTDVTRAVFRALVREAPLDVLHDPPREQTLAECAQGRLDNNAECRAEMAREIERGEQSLAEVN